mgnify:CR=1 FL=1
MTRAIGTVHIGTRKGRRAESNYIPLPWSWSFGLQARSQEASIQIFFTLLGSSRKSKNFQGVAARVALSPASSSWTWAPPVRLGARREGPSGGPRGGARKGLSSPRRLQKVRLQSQQAPPSCFPKPKKHAQGASPGPSSTFPKANKQPQGAAPGPASSPRVPLQDQAAVPDPKSAPN